jgi:thiol-disulfide isomerase/thioredoxin
MKFINSRLLRLPAVSFALACCFHGLLAQSPDPSGPTTADDSLAKLEELVAARPEPGTTLTQEASRLWWSEQSAIIAAQAEAFYTQYPSDPRRWRAVSRYLRASLHPIDAEVRQTRQLRSHQLADLAMVAPDISDDDWAGVVEWKFYRILQDPTRYDKATDKIDPAPLRVLLDKMTERMPQAPRLRGLEGQYLAVLLRQDETAAEAHLEKLSHSENSGVAKQAQGMMRLRSLRKIPVQLKFTAIDGREVDLASMRGKVVLIDFWATWCGPCIGEMPNVKKVYEKYHDKGFEVVGIALDKPSDLGKLEEEIERLELPWPQFLDAENRRNKFADDLGIIAIPAPLLFDQQGLLVSEKARGKRLEPAVAGLLGL